MFKKLALPFIIMAAVFIMYSNVYDMVFVYDDEFYIQKNQYLNSISNISNIFTTNSTAGAGFQDSFYRPIQFLFYLLVQQILGGEPWGFHLLNVFIHAINAILLFFLSQLVGFQKRSAFFVALLWAAHPVHTEVIAYISGTADPLQFFFTVAALIVLLKQSKAYLFFSSILFVAALLSKEVAVVFPGLAFAVLFLTKEKKWDYRTYLPVVLYLGIGLSYVGLRATVLDFNGDFHFYKTQNIYTENILYRIYTFLATLPNYLSLLVWPQNLHIDRAFPVYTEFFYKDVLLGSAILISLITVSIVSFFKKNPARHLTLSTIIWFFAAHSLHSGVLVPMNSLFLEHWLYVPSIAFFWASIYFSEKYFKKLLLPTVAVCAGLLAWHTYQQNRMWENPITLFSRILEFNPKATRVRHNLAMAYSDRGNDEYAQKQYEQILAEDPSPYPQTFHNLALIYLKKNDLSKGEELLLKAIEISPQFYPSYDYLIQVYKVRGDVQKVSEWEARKKNIKL